MKRLVLLFTVFTLLIGAGVYVLITNTTPLTPGQALGSGVAVVRGGGGRGGPRAPAPRPARAPRPPPPRPGSWRDIEL
jgi:hypothetical protein